jgi:CRP-like cAMP-binding protein
MAPPNPLEVLSLFLRRLRAHSHLDEADHQALLSIPARACRLAAHQNIRKLGEGADHGWLVASGLIGRIGETDDGLRQILTLYIPGEVANLTALSLPSDCLLEAVSDSTLLRLPHAALRMIADERPALKAALTREAMIGHEILAEWLLNIGRRDARARIAHFLCEMALRYRAAGLASGSEFIMPMTQEQLGDVLGLTPVHVNRMLKSLRQDGLVNLTRKLVAIRDWNALAAAGEFDSSYLHLGRVTEAAQPRFSNAVNS